METTPKWIPILFGAVMILMGVVILGAQFGIVPVEEGGRFLAPPLVITSLGAGLLLGGALLWIPARSPAYLRTALLLVAAILVLTVCNWTAFAPGVVYRSSLLAGPLQVSEQGDVSARLAFGVVAILVDAVFLSTLAAWIRNGLRRHDRRP